MAVSSLTAFLFSAVAKLFNPDKLTKQSAPHRSIKAKTSFHSAEKKQAGGEELFLGALDRVKNMHRFGA